MKCDRPVLFVPMDLFARSGVVMTLPEGAFCGEADTEASVRDLLNRLPLVRAGPWRPTCPDSEPKKRILRREVTRRRHAFKLCLASGS
jgi:hypothetical protein